jgi:putative SOS response-associated peptidase YedK
VTVCGRISLAVDADVLERRFDVTIPGELPRRYNVAPREDLLTVRDDAPATGAMLNWGLVPHWADDPDEVRRPINARAETVAETSVFRDAYRRRRCLVLADGFYEWRGERGAKQPYRIQRTDGAPFAFAGLWERWRGDGADLCTCTILTTAASPLMEPIHDRMPLVLTAAEEGPWLSGADVEAVVDPYPDAALEAYPVSTRVNDPTNDDPGLLDPAERTQSGLDEFSS